MRSAERHGTRWLYRSATFVIVLIAATAFVWNQMPLYGANALLHPARRSSTAPAPKNCENVPFSGADVILRGWRCHASGTARGTIVYLHGVGDSRTSAVGVINRFAARGFNVIVYDSRAQGESTGDVCTYGFFEKRDLHRVLDTIVDDPIVLIGASLGAAVALQEAADDSRVATIVSAETFSDLRTVATERAPGFFTSSVIKRAFAAAERQGNFHVDAVSPVEAARKISIPVLMIHGDADVETVPSHSRRVFDALAGEKRLRIVPGAHHGESLTGEVWNEVDHWIDEILHRMEDH